MRVREANAAARGDRRSVLVVEDEPVVARDIVARLRGLGYEVVGVARDGGEAVSKARDLSPDVILMDVRIPGNLDGIAAAEVIRQDSLAPIIFLTGFCDQATIQRARKAEPFAYLLKPFTEAELLSAIESAQQKCRIEMRLRQPGRLPPNSGSSVDAGLVTTDETGEVTFLEPITSEISVWPSEEAGGQDAGDIALRRIATPMAEAPQSAPPAQVHGSEIILVIEENDELRDRMARILGARGYRVLAARDSDEAFELASRNPGPIHLVLSDVTLPGSSVSEVARQTASRHPGARILLISGSIDEAPLPGGKAPVGMSVLEKPFAAETLLARVRAVLDG